MSRNIQHHQSKSLWNYTLSPGWKEHQIQILKNALMIFGVGKWKLIMMSNCLPGKSVGQIYMQTQRLVGQQSLAEFMGIQIDTDLVLKDNKQKKGVLRKNNFIINTNDNLTKAQKQQLIKINKKKYTASQEKRMNARIPRYKKQGFLSLQEIETNKLSTLQKLIHLEQLRKNLENKIKQKEDQQANRVNTQ